MDPIVELLNVRTDFRYRYAQKKDTHSVRAKNADRTRVSIQRKIKFNVGPCDFALFLFNAFWFSSFFGLNFKKQPHYRRISFHSHPVASDYIVLQPVSNRASRTSGILVQFIHHSWLIGYCNIWLDLAIDITLDRSKAYICLYIDLDTSASLPGWIISMNLDARRQKSQVYYDHVLTLPAILCQV